MINKQELNFYFTTPCFKNASTIIVQKETCLPVFSLCLAMILLFQRHFICDWLMGEENSILEPT